MQPPRLPGTAVADGSGLRHPVVVHHSRLGPQPLDGGDGGADASARLAGYKNGPHASPAQVEALLDRHLAQPQSIGRRAAEDGDAVFQNGSQPGQAAHSPAGNAEAAPLRGRFEGGPKSQKGTEGKCKKDPVTGGNARRRKDAVPVVEHPLPAFRGIQPVHRLAGGGAGSAEPGVAVQAVGQVGPVGRVTPLILHQLRFLGEGHGRPEGIQGWNLCRQSRLPELGAIEAIGLRKRPQQGPQPSKLVSLYPAAFLHRRAFDAGLRIGSAGLQCCALRG